MNLEIRRLEDAIIKEINGSVVDIEVKRLILQNVLNLVSKEADKQITAEIKANMESDKEEQAE